MMKLLLAACCGVFFCGMMQSQSYSPPNGYVPDATTAVKIAEAVIIPVYGRVKIESERPFKATLQGDTWTVEGTFRCPDGTGGITTECAGGVAIVKLSKTNARIISMIHGK